jgi:hypothetical protein
MKDKLLYHEGPLEELPFFALTGDLRRSAARWWAPVHWCAGTTVQQQCNDSVTTV